MVSSGQLKSNYDQNLLNSEKRAKHQDEKRNIELDKNENENQVEGGSAELSLAKQNSNKVSLR